MRRLDRRVAVVTGAGSGIGRATARRLAAAGCELALVDLNADSLAAVAAELSRRRDDRRITTHRVDVADRDAMRSLAEAVVDAHGVVHLLVNNAGVDAAAPFVEQPEADFDWVMRVNFSGVVHGTRAFLPALLAADRGHVVNVSSLAGLVAFPIQAAYCASKFAVRGFSEALRIELAGTTVGVTCVHPGTVRTDVLRSARFTDAPTQARLVALMDRYGVDPDRVARRIVRAVRRDRARVVVGPDAHLVVWVARLLPGPWRWGLGAALRRARASDAR